MEILLKQKDTEISLLQKQLRDEQRSLTPATEQVKCRLSLLEEPDQRMQKELQKPVSSVSFYTAIQSPTSAKVPNET